MQKANSFKLFLPIPSSTTTHFRHVWVKKRKGSTQNRYNNLSTLNWFICNFSLNINHWYNITTAMHWLHGIELNWTERSSILGIVCSGSIWLTTETFDFSKDPLTFSTLRKTDFLFYSFCRSLFSFLGATITDDSTNGGISVCRQHESVLLTIREGRKAVSGEGIGYNPGTPAPRYATGSKFAIANLHWHHLSCYRSGWQGWSLLPWSVAAFHVLLPFAAVTANKPLHSTVYFLSVSSAVLHCAVIWVHHGAFRCVCCVFGFVIDHW
jgi:hypothetical protein